MITYLKHVGGKKHADLKNIKTTKKKDGQESLKDKESAEVPAKTDVTEQGTKKRKGGRIKMIAKKRSRPQQVDKDDDELKLSLVITPDEDKEVDYEILDRKYPIIEWKSEFITTKPQYDESKEVEEVNLNVVTRRVHTLMTETGLVIHMLVENKYPLKKEALSQMLKIKLESKEDYTMALELIRFVKKQIAELELDNSDGVEK
ncbi:hypothetical protein Tco_0522759 [Tanacetum coccineum]